MVHVLNPEQNERNELMRAGNGEGALRGSGVTLREFVSGACGARDFSTGTATFPAEARLPSHKHAFSEVLIVLDGAFRTQVEDRSYHLKQFDCMHVPAGIAHQTMNLSEDSSALALWAFASAAPSQELVSLSPCREERGLSNPAPDDPESIMRFAQAETYELSPGAEFRDLFAGRLGVADICGGYGKFNPGASLPCHIHQCDESITIVEGEARCLVQGKAYTLSGYDTAFIPEGKPHRFLNDSDGLMAMIWVYASSEPERTLLESAHCDGTSDWPGAEAVRERWDDVR